MGLQGQFRPSSSPNGLSIDRCLLLLLCQEAEARHGSEKVSPFQSYKYDNTIAIDVLTTLLYTSSTTAELALAVTVHHHASES